MHPRDFEVSVVSSSTQPCQCLLQISLRRLSLPIPSLLWVAEESMESLKYLHYVLDDCKVACVLITNNALDAAKMNRAVVVYRQSQNP